MLNNFSTAFKQHSSRTNSCNEVIFIGEVNNGNRTNVSNETNYVKKNNGVNYVNEGNKFNYINEGNEVNYINEGNEVNYVNECNDVSEDIEGLIREACFGANNDLKDLFNR